MPNVLIYKARALKPQTRAAVEAELGRALRDDEDVSIMAFGAHEAPTGEARSRAGQELQADSRRIEKKRASGSNETAEGAFQQALKKMRPESES
jgi:F0F1-type ATP synthase epsilon subunit